MAIAEILRPIGEIARALDSVANIEFKDFDLAKVSIYTWFGSVSIPALSRNS